MSGHQHISENIQRVEERILTACRQAGRERTHVRLMAVSKTHPAELLVEGFSAGLRLFGENRVQEFQEKKSALDNLRIPVADTFTSEHQAAVHLIGHLQSNKTARAAEIFSAVDTVDSLKLAQRLNDAAWKANRQLSVLIELKLSDEEAKTGLEPDSKELTDLLEQLPDLHHLQTRGLMTVAPFDENPETARKCFRKLRQLREELAARYPRLDLSELSMGMSVDFEIAIEEGSTLVRIGTAIFGARPKPT